MPSLIHNKNMADSASVTGPDQNSPDLSAGWLGPIVRPGPGQPEQGQTGAIRQIRPEHLAQLGHLQTVLRFAQQNRHPHILPLGPLYQHTSGQTGLTHWQYEMPLARAGSLRGVFERYKAAGATIDLPTMLDVAQQIAEGLNVAHASGLAHGNLKPENVLLEPLPAPRNDEVSVWLSDFGLNSLRPPVLDNTDLQRPELAPSQRQGAIATPRSDLYALGALLYEGLSGEPLPLVPQPQHLQKLPDPAARLLGKCLGFTTPFADAGAFLGYLRAMQQATTLTSINQAAGGQTQPERRQQEGQQQNESHPDPLPGSTLELYPTQRQVRQNVTLQVSLHNRSPQRQRYNLEITPPPGSTLLGGTLRRQFELAAGDEYHDTLSLSLRPSALQSRQVTVHAVAHRLAARPETYFASSDEAAETVIWPPAFASLQASAHLQQRPLVPWGVALALGLGLLGGLWWAAQPPKIQQFALQAAESGSGQSQGGQTGPLVGQPYSLTWKTSGARQVQMSELPGKILDAEGSLKFPGTAQPQTYTLVASGLLTSQRQQITVKPRPLPPKIVSFKVIPAGAKAGDTVQVQWNVEHAQKVYLAPFGMVEGSGTRTVTLQRDQTFTLSAQQGSTPGPNDLSSAIKTTLRSPQILTFNVAPSQIKLGQMVTVSWQVQGARTVRMAPLGLLPAAGSRSFAPTRSGTLTLKASNGQEEKTASANVLVSRPPARVVYFRASTNSPREGQPVQLNWATSDASAVRLSWGNRVQAVPVVGHLTLSASQQAQTITLTALDAANQPTIQTLTLTVKPAPADKTGLTPVKPNTLKPSTLNPGLNPGASTDQKPSIKAPAPQTTAPQNQVPQSPKPPPKGTAKPPISKPITIIKPGIPKAPASAGQSSGFTRGTGTSRASQPTLTAYNGLGGTWNHNHGSLSLQVSGSRATGTMRSNRPDLPSGSIRGSFSGNGNSVSFSGFVTPPGGKPLALVLRFNVATQRFDGLYASASRGAWCGWRGAGPGGC